MRLSPLAFFLVAPENHPVVRKKFLDGKLQDSGDLGGDIKYWTGNEIWIGTPAGSSSLSELLLTKKGLGPVAVMLNLAMWSDSKVRKRKPRVHAFLEMFLQLADSVEGDKNVGTVEWVEKILANDCNFRVGGGMKALTAAQVEKYEKVRKNYLEEISQIRQRKFEAGNPGPLRAVFNFRSSPQRWTREEAVRLGTLQVKCGILQNLSERPSEVDVLIEMLPPNRSAMLKAKIGEEGDLFKTAEEFLSGSGWTLKPRKTLDVAKPNVGALKKCFSWTRKAKKANESATADKISITSATIISDDNSKTTATTISDDTSKTTSTADPILGMLNIVKSEIAEAQRKAERSAG